MYVSGGGCWEGGCFFCFVWWGLVRFYILGLVAGLLVDCCVYGFLFFLSKVPCRVFKLLNCGIYGLWGRYLGENRLLSDNLRHCPDFDLGQVLKKGKNVNQSTLRWYLN